MKFWRFRLVTRHELRKLETGTSNREKDEGKNTICTWKIKMKIRFRLVSKSRLPFTAFSLPLSFASSSRNTARIKIWRGFSLGLKWRKSDIKRRKKNWKCWRKKIYKPKILKENKIKKKKNEMKQKKSTKKTCKEVGGESGCRGKPD